MNENVFALLKRSSFFNQTDKPFPIKIEILSHRHFKFFIPGCFSDFPERDDLDLFKFGMRVLLKRYVQTWAKIVEKKGDFNWENHSDKVFDFFNPYNWRKTYEEIKNGKKELKLKVGANNSLLKIKRMGNILAFDVENLNPLRNEHIGGTEAILFLCRAEDLHNKQGVYELLKEVKISFPLQPEAPKNNRNMFDFQEIFSQIKELFCIENWIFNTNELIEDYLKKQRGIFLGRLYGFEMLARLLHGNELEVKAGAANFEKELTERTSQQEKDSNHDSIWREGNVKHVGDSIYRFVSADYLRLELSLKTALADGVFDNEMPEAKTYEEQLLFVETAFFFINRLSSMQMEKRIKSMS